MLLYQQACERKAADPCLDTVDRGIYKRLLAYGKATCRGASLFIACITQSNSALLCLLDRSHIPRIDELSIDPISRIHFLKVSQLRAT